MDKSEPEWELKPPKAYDNPRFLHSDAGRPLRMLAELSEPGVRLARHGVTHTVVFFGSARNPNPEDAEAHLEALRAHRSGPALSAEAEARTERRAARVRRALHYYQLARQLSHVLTEWSLAQEDPDHRFLVCSGGGPGIMEAANRGARDAGGRSVAFGISLPFEERLNPYSDNDLSFDFHYFFVRKYWFFFHARALVIFPGGFGTLDELFEVLTLVQNRKTSRAFRIVLVGREFWEAALNFSLLVEWDVISAEDLGLFSIVDTCEEARDLVLEAFPARAEETEVPPR
jgi:uncharacterized protein (TIGR00730 family)